ncbi:hypothetical protein [Pseudomonas sp.]|uniref:hypothetical protein n=1 Tax=Pseudomonas sp. TaxID=306 RepID=UPI002FC60C42
MNIDKSKLQPLLWAVVGAWKAGDQDLHLHTDALDQFLGEQTVEQVTLQLLAELNFVGEVRDAYAADKKHLAFALNDARAETEALRQTMRTAAGKLRSYSIAQPDRAWEKVNDALGLLDYGGRQADPAADGMAKEVSLG